MVLAAVLGLLFGFVGSIPVAGPISALVVTRGLEGRFRSGVWIAVGGGLVEALYALLAFWGFSTFLADYPIITPISRGGGAVVLLVLGVTFWRRQTAEDSGASEADVPPPRDHAWQSFALGAWICAINPTLIATWTAVVTTVHGSGLVDFEGRMAIPFAIGCAVGIAGWFLTLLAIIRRYRDSFSNAVLRRLMKVVAVFLVAVGLWFAWRFVQDLAS
jgi:threonine/homoserine/homoserine lactone efflux protein